MHYHHNPNPPIPPPQISLAHAKLLSRVNGKAVHVQEIAHFGALGPDIYHDFVKVLHGERKLVLAALTKLVRACQPVLRKGVTPAFVHDVEAALSEIETRRSALLFTRHIPCTDY